MKNKISINIGIPTYNAGHHLVSTLESIYKSPNYKYVKQIVIAVDGSKISKEILNKIKNTKLIIINFNKRSGQSQRINDLMRWSKSELLILTNDDVIFEKNAIKNVIKIYSSKNVDLITAKVSPLKPKTYVEEILGKSEIIKSEMIKGTKNQSTYLSSNGRFLGLSRKYYKNLSLPKNLINSDAYIYFYALKNNYVISNIDEVSCYFREPSTIKEYSNQVYKFQKSRKENLEYFDLEFINSNYDISIINSIKANIKVLFNYPIHLTGYYILFGLARVINIFRGKSMSNMEKGYWSTDLSTKYL